MGAALVSTASLSSVNRNREVTELAQQAPLPVRPLLRRLPRLLHRDGRVREHLPVVRGVVRPHPLRLVLRVLPDLLARQFLRRVLVYTVGRYLVRPPWLYAPWPWRLFGPRLRALVTPLIALEGGPERRPFWLLLRLLPRPVAQPVVHEFQAHLVAPPLLRGLR